MWKQAALCGLVLILAYVLHHPSVPEDYALSIQEKALKDGYQCTVHNVTTADGFVLALFRISAQGGPPVLLLHGFGLGPESFVFNFYGKSVAYRLADAGFEVWLGSSRGNVHSRRHVSLEQSQADFWDWTTWEMGRFDVPAFVSTVLSLSGQSKLAIVGHSQGGTMTLMALSVMPALQSQVSSVLLLASPPGKIPSLPLPVRFLSSKFMQQTLRFWGVYKILDPPLRLVVKVAHYLPLVGRFLAPMSFDCSLNGDDPAFGIVSSAKSMGGTSVKNLEYVRQLATSPTNDPYGFHYGPVVNTLVYGTQSPPLLNYSSVAVPVAYFAGKFDDFVCEWEMNLMKSLVGERLKVHRTDLHHDHNSLLLSGNLDYLAEAISFLQAQNTH